MSCTLRPKPPSLRPLAKEPHIPGQQNETGDGSFHEGSAMNVVDFATRRQIGEGALYLDNQDEDEFYIPTYLEMKLGCNQSARGSLSPSRRRAGVRARRFRLPPGAKRWAVAAIEAFCLFAAILAVLAVSFVYSGYSGY